MMPCAPSAPAVIISGLPVFSDIGAHGMIDGRCRSRNAPGNGRCQRRIMLSNTDAATGTSHKETQAMLFLLTNRTRANLSPAQYGELVALAKSFYASIPAEVNIRGEWAAIDRSANYTLLEAPDLQTVQRIQAPYEPYTDTVIVPVTAITGWAAS